MTDAHSKWAQQCHGRLERNYLNGCQLEIHINMGLKGITLAKTL